MRLPYPFIQLPLSFDAERLAEEVLAIEEQAWRPHPQGYAGNTMLPLVAVNGDPANEEFRGEMQPTPHLERCPYVLQAISSLGATIGRTRLMRLDGNAEVSQHADSAYYWTERVRTHVPIVTQPSVRFECGDAAVNMAAGQCWIFDTWRLHRVINAHETRRIHLVVDTVGGARFWQLVEAGRPQPAAAQTAPNWAPKLIAFQPGAEPPPIAFEAFNIPNVMSPWEVSSQISTLLGEASAHPNSNAARKTASIFIRDWRALWAAFGDGDEGVQFYAQRLQRFLSEFQRDSQGIQLPNSMMLFDAVAAAVGAAALAQNRLVQGARVPAMARGP
jgi:hypothetical protein